MTIGISKERLEEWSPVVGHENYYEVSTFGRVRKVCGEIISQHNNEQGYKLVRLSNPRTMARVNRLVAMAFIENNENLPYVNHIDNCRSNNILWNLEWCTQKQNLNHAANQGRMKWDQRKGTHQSKVFKDPEIFKEIQTRYANGEISYRDIFKEYRISQKTARIVITQELPGDPD